MSSRVLVRGASAQPTVVSWRQSAAPRAADPPPSSGPSETTSPIQLRIAELERTLQSETAAAYKSGLREGEKQARGQAAVEMRSALEAISKSVRDLADLRPRLRREAESDVVKLAIAIARRILHREMSVDPSAMQALVQVALSKLDRQDTARVRVHPTQAQNIKQYLESTSGRNIEVVADPNREPGSLIFETNRGQLDGSVNAQLDEIERGLTDRMNQI